MIPAGVTLVYDGNEPATPEQAASIDAADALKAGAVGDAEAFEQELLVDLQVAITRRDQSWRGWIIHYPEGAL